MKVEELTVKIEKEEISDFWIQYLDKEYIEHKKLVETNNKEYFYFPNIKLSLVTQGLYIIFKKYEKKTQFIIQDEYLRNLYLTDIDIINIIINSKEHIYNLIIEILYNFVSEPIFEKEIFLINNKEFYLYKIIQSELLKNKINILESEDFLTRADFRLKYIDLITLIGLIISKEYLFSPNETNFRHIRQAKKYYVLSKAFREGKYIKELKSREIDCSKGLNYIYRQKGSIVTIDQIFDDFTL